MLWNVVQTSWSHIIGCVHVMDSGVRHLCIDGGAVSYEFIRREYAFERVMLQLDFSDRSVYPRLGSLFRMLH